MSSISADIKTKLPNWMPMLSCITSLVVAGVGVMAFSLHQWTHARTQLSVIDEGLYLYKGYLFTSGRYIPFQDGGPWTNHMPLSFLIPGWVQQLFGLGLRTGRFYALGIGLLFIIGLWLVSRRISNRWLAALAVWVFALNPVTVKIFSQTLSQGLIAAMLIWTLVFTLGPKRSPWQVALGAILAGAILLTRLNMLLFLPLLILYIFWEHGKQAGWIAILSSTIVVLVGHIFFWPDILKIWARWLPASLTPFLDSWREASLVDSLWNVKFDLSHRLDSLGLTLGSHMFSFLGALFAWLSWPSGTKENTQRSTFKIGVFLSTVFIGLFLAHAWAALGNYYCVYCFQMYTAFYSMIGVLLFVLAAKHWFPQHPLPREIGVIIIIVLLSLLLARPFLDNIAPQVLSSQVFRISNLQPKPEAIDLSILLLNKFRLEYATQVAIIQLFLMSLILIFVATLLVVFYSWLIRKEDIPRLTVTGSILVGVTIAWLLILTIVFGVNLPNYDCGEDVIQSYETAGDYFARMIRPDSTVYWMGGESPTLLLYLPSVEIFPPQLNVEYTFRLSGDPEDLLRFGSWNKALADDWLRKADYVLLEESKVNDSIMQLAPLPKGEYIKIAQSPPVLGCRPDSFIHIYERIQE